MRAWLVVLVVIALGPRAAHAGAWARPQGGVYARAGVGLFFGQPAFLLAGGVGTEGRFIGIAGELYAEVGLGRGFELDVSARWVDNRHDRDGQPTLTSDGPEDAELLLKWAPFSALHALSFTAGARVSMYERSPDAEIAAGTPQRGPGGQDIVVGVGWGRSFYPVMAWVNVDIGYRLRIGNASSAVRVRGEFGGRIVGPLAAAATLEIQPAFGRDTDLTTGAPAPIPTVFAIGAKLFARIAAGFGASLDAAWLPDTVNDGPGWRVGLSATYELDRR